MLLSLIKKILEHSPSKRYKILNIKNHLWFKKKFKDSGTVPIPSALDILSFFFMLHYIIFVKFFFVEIMPIVHDFQKKEDFEKW